MSRIDRLRESLHKRKQNRERHRRKHQRRRTLREMRAVQHLRALIHRLTAPHTMWDAVTVEHIPRDARAVAGYINGNYRTFPELVKGWPKARKISIAVSSDHDARVLDVEPGDASNADAVGWYHRHDRKKFGTAIFYTSASNVGALIAALAAAGIKRADYKIWGAHYTGHRHICAPKTCGYPAVEACQFTTHDESLDESAVSLRFWS